MMALVILYKKRDNNGKVIFTVGERGKEAPWQGGEMFK